MLDIIRRTVYEFYKNQTAPTIDKIFTAIRQKTKNTYEFPYEKTTLLKILGVDGVESRDIAYSVSALTHNYIYFIITFIINITICYSFFVFVLNSN